MKIPTVRCSALALGVVLAVGSGLGAGCGYQVVRYRGAIPGAETVAITALENGTFEPGLESVVLDALRREVIARGGLRLVDDPEAADLVISGRVQSLHDSTRSFTSVALSVEHEVVLGLALAARRHDGEAIPIDLRAQTERDRYLASADLEAMRKNRREVIHRLASVLAARVYDSLYESAAPVPGSEPSTP